MNGTMALLKFIEALEAADVRYTIVGS